MRGSSDEGDDSETPLLEQDDKVVTIASRSDSESPEARSPRRTQSSADRFRSRASGLLGARRTPSNLFKNSNDTDQQNEVSNSHCDATFP